MLARKLGFIGVFLLAPSVALAQSVAPEEPSEGPSHPAPSEEEKELEKTRALYAQGKKAYDEGDYEGSLELFSEVYERSGHPALLFNMAQAHRLAGPEHCLAAHRLYVEYLVRDAEAPNGDEVRERIRELEPCAKKMEEEQAAPSVDERESPSASEEVVRTPTVRPAAVLTIVSGVVLFAGVGIFTAGKLRFAEAQKDCPCEPGSLSQWETMEKVGVAAMAVGAVGAATGGVWWWAAVHSERGAESAVFGLRGSF